MTFHVEPFIEPARWTEEDEIPWDYDAGGSVEGGYDGDWTGFEVEE